MNLRLLFTALLISVVSISNTGAQEYLEMMNDTSANFFEIQKAANEYFAKVGTGKGTGYKQYKRWEYENESKAYPDGNLSLQGVDVSIKEFIRFKSKTFRKSASTKVWQSLGPDNINTNNGHYSPGLGRIDRIAVDPKNHNILYIGGPANGVWKSVDGGQNWVSKTDFVGSRGVCGIVVHPVNTNTIFWATGDGDHSSTNCTGIFISRNGGETWEQSGLSFNYTDQVKGRKLIMHPERYDTLLFSCSSGIYKTSNGGKSWVLKQAGAFDDIFYKPDEPEIVYASNVGAFYRSTNGGESFTKASVELAGRVFIGLTAAAPDVVYLMTGERGIYKSNDKGVTFSFIGDHQYTKGTMWHHGTFIVSPEDENLIHTGEFETHKSTDGGISWVKTSKWTFPNEHYIHCDIHDFLYVGNKLYVCTDGGVSYTTDEGNSWVNLFNTMVALEPYRLGVCKSNANMHMNGSQDNGIYLWDGDIWDGLYGADGMECIIDYENPNNKYFVIQNGGVRSTANSVTQPGEGGWVSPLVMHPANPSVLFFGNDKVRKTTDRMQTWTVIGDFGSGNVTDLAIGESNPDYLYASKGSKLWRTTNGGAGWTDITAGLPNQWITRIAVHPKNPLIVAVSLGSYVSGRKVYLSRNGGATWENYSNQLPNIQARCLVFDDTDNEALYLGMDIGIYYIDNTMDSWELYSEGFPMVGVNELEIHHSSDQIFAASLGRGIWKNSTKNAPQYCSASGSAETAGNWIKNFTLGTINNNSDYGSYSDFKSVFTELRIGSEYSMSVKLNAHDANDKCFAWMDSNNNKVFENDELITLGSFNADHIASATFAIPEDAVPGYYTLRVRTQKTTEAAIPCGSIEGEVEDYSVLILKKNLQYCSAVGASGTGADWIKNVSLNSLNNTSVQTDYSDFTDKSTDLEVKKQYNLVVTLNHHFDPDKCGAWIDYNQNGEFESGEFINLPLFNSGQHIYRASFTVPESAMGGKTRMRVRVVYNNSLVPCNSIFGEVEDYTVNIEKLTSLKVDGSINEKLKVYPNPTRNMVNIEVPQVVAVPANLYVYSTTGKLIYQEILISDKASINTSRFKSGLYFVKLDARNSMYYESFVVN